MTNRHTPSERSVFRYPVPVDDQWHTVALSGPIVHVACRDSDAIVEFWAISGAESECLRAFRVFGTGHPLPPAATTHVGTAFAAGGALVWHLFEHERLGGDAA